MSQQMRNHVVNFYLLAYISCYNNSAIIRNSVHTFRRTALLYYNVGLTINYIYHEYLKSCRKCVWISSVVII